MQFMHSRFLRLFLALVFYRVSVPAALFGTQATPEIVHFELADNVIYLRMGVNGSGPYCFVFDTGSRNSLISLDLVKALHIPMDGTVAMIGAGGQRPEPAWLVQAHLQIGRLDVYDPTVIATQLPFKRVFGRTVDGVLGFDIISSFAIEIDFKTKLLMFGNPDNPSFLGHVIGIAVSNGRPLLNAEITNGHSRVIPCILLVDTGTTRGLEFNAHFVEKHKLPERGRKKSISPLESFGRETFEVVSRVGSLRLGPYVLQKPVAGFLKAAVGTSSLPDEDGVLGVEVLKRFRLVLNFKRGEVVLEKNEDFSLPYVYDASGIVIFDEGLAEGHIYTVHYVVPSSPAQAAGLLQGDIILAIDGHLVSGMPLHMVRKLLTKPNRFLSFSILRGEKKLGMGVKTRTLV